MPAQCVFLVGPNVTSKQNCQKNRDLRDSKPTKLFVAYSPREKKDRLHVKDHKQDGDQVKPNGMAAARAGRDGNAAFVNFLLHLTGGTWPQQLRHKQQRHQEHQ